MTGSEQFRVPKTSFQENVIVNDAVPASTKYKSKWAVLGLKTDYIQVS